MKLFLEHFFTLLLFIFLLLLLFLFLLDYQNRLSGLLRIQPLIWDDLTNPGTKVLFGTSSFVTSYGIFCYLKLGWHPVTAVQYTFTHKQYTEQHNETEYKVHKNKNINITIRIHKHNNKNTQFAKLNRSLQNIQTYTSIYIYIYIQW